MSSSSSNNNNTVSYCVACDALPGECTHTGPRYLDPVVYTRAEAGGWIVPEHEQHRYHNPPTHTKTPPPAPEPTPIQHLVVQLEERIYLEPPLEQKLRDAYESDPLRVTRLVDTILNTDTLTNPGGYLHSRLKQLHP